MVPTEVQRNKAAKVFTDLLRSYGDIPQPKIDRFGVALAKNLEGLDINIFGRFGHSDRILLSALKKANLTDSAFSDLIMVAFEGTDKVRYLLDGAWQRR